MEPGEVLKKLVQDIERGNDIPLTYEELEEYFQLLVSVVHLAEVSESLCWEAGVALLLISGEHQHELFNRFGYAAIAEALYSALKSGSLPRGLQWYTSGFLPSDIEGDVMLAVLSNPAIEDAIRKGINPSDFRLDLDCLNPSDSRLGSALVLFLSHLHRFGLFRQVQLRWAAKLVDHLSIENPARLTAEKLVLDGLITTNRFINAFYWLQMFFIDDREGNLSEDVFQVLTEITKLVRGAEGGGGDILSSLGFQSDFLYLIMASERAQLYMTFLTLWLQFYEGYQIQKDLIEVGTSLLWEKYSNLSLFIRKVSDWTLKPTNGDESSGGRGTPTITMLSFLDQKIDLLNDLKEDLQQPPFYRGRGLPVEIWVACRDQVFLPIIRKLEVSKSSTQLEIIRDEINELDPSELVKDSEIHKYEHAKSRKLQSDELRMLTTDFQNYVDDLATIAKVYVRAYHTEKFMREINAEIEWSTLQRECKELIDRIPSIEEGFNTYLFPVLEDWEASWEKSRDEHSR